MIASGISTWLQGLARLRFLAPYLTQAVLMVEESAETDTSVLLGVLLDQLRELKRKVAEFWPKYLTRGDLYTEMSSPGAGGGLHHMDVDDSLKNPSTSLDQSALDLVFNWGSPHLLGMVSQSARSGIFSLDDVDAQNVFSSSSEEEDGRGLLGEKANVSFASAGLFLKDSDNLRKILRTVLSVQDTISGKPAPEEQGPSPSSSPPPPPVEREKGWDEALFDFGGASIFTRWSRLCPAPGRRRTRPSGLDLGPLVDPLLRDALMDGDVRRTAGGFKPPKSPAVRSPPNPAPSTRARGLVEILSKLAPVELPVAPYDYAAFRWMVGFLGGGRFVSFEAGAALRSGSSKWFLERHQQHWSVLVSSGARATDTTDAFSRSALLSSGVSELAVNHVLHFMRKAHSRDDAESDVVTPEEDQVQRSSSRPHKTGTHSQEQDFSRQQEPDLVFCQRRRAIVALDAATATPVVERIITVFYGQAGNLVLHPVLLFFSMNNASAHPLWRPPIREEDEDDRSDGEDEAEGVWSYLSPSGGTAYGRQLSLDVVGFLLKLFEYKAVDFGVKIQEENKNSSRRVHADTGKTLALGEAVFWLSLPLPVLDLFVDNLLWPSSEVEARERRSYPSGGAFSSRLPGFAAIHEQKKHLLENVRVLGAGRQAANAKELFPGLDSVFAENDWTSVFLPLRYFVRGYVEPALDSVLQTDLDLSSANKKNLLGEKTRAEMYYRRRAVFAEYRAEDQRMLKGVKNCQTKDYKSTSMSFLRTQNNRKGSIYPKVLLSSDRDH